MTYDDFRVTGHIAAIYRDPWTIQTFDVSRDASAASIITHRSHVRAGSYTRLLRIGDHYTGARKPGMGTLWMSDTHSEWGDHYEAISRATGRVLLNGLGLGCVLRAMLAKPEVEHVDVVERDGSLVALMRDVAPWVSDARVQLHVADAFEQARSWPRGTVWDVAWHDIWANKCSDDLAEHAKLQRSYGRRVGWQGCWVHEDLLYHRARFGW